MNQNITLSIGNLLLVDKFNEEYGYFNQVFNGIGGKAKNILPCAKLFILNRLGECFSINQIISGIIESYLRNSNFLMTQKSVLCIVIWKGLELIFRSLLNATSNLSLLKKLASEIQYIDFSSSYFEGKGGEFGEYGYSRDGQPGKNSLLLG